MGKVIAVCISEEKGTAKKEQPEITLKEDFGIVNDAHAGKWHRQVSLLGIEQIEDFRSRGGKVDFGAFGENIITGGFDLKSLPVGTLFHIGDVTLELTQIGKECHDHCAIFHQVGDCIMPREGVFTRVLKGGSIKAGDEILMEEPAPDRPFTAAVITLSDRSAAGEREDKSGPVIREMLTEAGIRVEETILIPDSAAMLKGALIRLSDQRQLNVIFTTGGTGFSERDITPEATASVCDRAVPGIAEALRAYSMTITKNAMLSRAYSGIRKKTLIINLPGSPKACREELMYILEPLKHGLDILRGTGDD